MKILCLTSRLPYPPDRGDRLRAFHILEHLAPRHELTLLSFIAAEAERDYLPALRDYCRQVDVVRLPPLRSAATAAANAWRRDPLQALYYRSRAMSALVARTAAAARFDAAYVHLFRMAPYAAPLSQLYRVVDLTDAISAEIDLSLPYRGAASRLVYRFEAPRITRYECWVAAAFEETWLISAADRDHLAARCPGANLRVVPNGVDLETFRPTGAPPDAERLIFVGHMGVFHNVDAATFLVRDVLPLVRQQVPGVRLTIAGAAPDPAVLQLAADSLAPGQAAVEVTGFVDDLNAYLNRAALFVAPLRFSAGVQNKVLEAMAAARPVITTSLTNRGLGAEPGRDLLVADDAPAIAAAVVSLLRDPDRCRAVGTAARRFVAAHYSWHHAVEQMNEIERELGK